MLDRVMSYRPLLPAAPARPQSSKDEERPGRGRASDQPESISSLFRRDHNTNAVVEVAPDQRIRRTE